METDRINEIFKSMRIKAICSRIQRHPSQTFYDVKLDPTCRIQKIRSSLEDLALALQVHSIPICQPLHAEGLVRLQVATGKRDSVRLDEHYSCPEGRMNFFLGIEANGRIVETDMSENPHMLVAGSTGSGKTIALHTIIGNAMKKRVELWMADPKRVELSPYRNVSSCYVEDLPSTINMFEQLIDKMEDRYDLLAQAQLSSWKEAKGLSPIMVVVDELADLIVVDEKKRLEGLVARLAQKSRAAGIFIVLSTQRPSSGVINGLIKANFPARLACRVANRVDSQVVLDQQGAENLLGRGDAVLKNHDHTFTRFQVAYSDAKVNLRNR